MKRKVWILVQQLLPKRNSQSWELNRKALAYEPWNMSVRLRGRCRPTDQLSVLSEPRHARRIGCYYLVAETSSVSSVFIARGYLGSNALNRHPFRHLPKTSEVFVHWRRCWDKNQLEFGNGSNNSSHHFGWRFVQIREGFNNLCTEFGSCEKMFFDWLLFCQYPVI